MMKAEEAGWRQVFSASPHPHPHLFELGTLSASLLLGHMSSRWTSPWRSPACHPSQSLDFVPEGEVAHKPSRGATGVQSYTKHFCIGLSLSGNRCVS